MDYFCGLSLGRLHTTITNHDKELKEPGSTIIADEFSTEKQPAGLAFAVHKVFEQRCNQEQQYPGAERTADEKPIQGNAGTGQQAFQYAGQVIGDGVGGEPDAHHDRGETHRREPGDQGKAE
jgi:hypothetical protein